MWTKLISKINVEFQSTNILYQKIINMLTIFFHYFQKLKQLNEIDFSQCHHNPKS